MITVYAGGAVDYAAPSLTHEWRHRLESPTVSVYCPVCAYDDHLGIDVSMKRNDIALMAADRAVFLLDGTFTVGTPVEIHQRLARRHPSTVLIVHPLPLGMFVRTWEERGVTVVPDWSTVPDWLVGGA